MPMCTLTCTEKITHIGTHTYEHPDKYLHIYYATCQIRENEEERVGEKGRGKEDSL